ncbi:hypothetical protein RASY3_02420 [Ruminococcus albus SY3]|uniref:Polysaccharide pyruvyl transferase domain-containing protein n=1 Tax=Ruminococcus albus SY3 TaxID=1341156 RepID=A0A011V638_RUMAL|nr:polysaccharide pyruvyl transferase family protein [Ruminococcus albus]EXM40992.1 hypothetical protein RASY3_02420 [Ruminococcus albus SY3]
MKTVGLMTCYMDNFGACLQAYALQHTIEKMGLKCEIIKHTPIKNLKEFNIFTNLGRTAYHYLKGVSNLAYRYDNYRHPCFVSFRKQYLKFSKKNYLEEKDLFNDPPIYDYYVTGSDQIWNPNLYGGKLNLAYFLDFVPQDKPRIAYAPSIGVSSISNDCKTQMKGLLQKFSAVSVRESDGKKIVDDVLDCGCRVVLDPTLLLNRSEWQSLMSERLIKEDYIFLYLFSDREYIGNFVNYARDQLKMKVVTIPFNKREYNSDFIKIKKAGPLEFINLISNAKLVITDSFHATAFSINLHTPFYSLLRNTKNDQNNMNSRIYSILELIHLENRIIEEGNEYPENLLSDIDFETVDRYLINKRDEDIAFIKCSLGK